MSSWMDGRLYHWNRICFGYFWPRGPREVRKCIMSSWTDRRPYHWNAMCSGYFWPRGPREVRKCIGNTMLAHTVPARAPCHRPWQS